MSAGRARAEDGAELVWWSTGSGEPLLLVAGQAVGHRSWDPVLPALAAHHRVLTFDHRGIGRSTTGSTGRPTTRDLAKINGAVAKRRENLARVVTNFRLIAEELSRSDTNLAEFVSSQNAVFGAFADSEQSIRETLQRFPSALRETRGALQASADLSGSLNPSLTALLPSARALAPALREVRPFLIKTEPAIREQIRPFTTEVAPTITELKRAAQPLAHAHWKL